MSAPPPQKKQKRKCSHSDSVTHAHFLLLSQNPTWLVYRIGYSWENWGEGSALFYGGKWSSDYFICSWMDFIFNKKISPIGDQSMCVMNKKLRFLSLKAAKLGRSRTNQKVFGQRGFFIVSDATFLNKGWVFLKFKVALFESLHRAVNCEVTVYARNLEHDLHLHFSQEEHVGRSWVQQ